MTTPDWKAFYAKRGVKVKKQDGHTLYVDNIEKATEVLLSIPDTTPIILVQYRRFAWVRAVITRAAAVLSISKTKE